jgi:hypothetical protein
MRIAALLLLACLGGAADAQRAPYTLSTRGDFDGDGRADMATYVVEPGRRTRMTALLSSQPAEVVIEETDGRHYGDFFETLPPGSYTPLKEGPNHHPVPVQLHTDVIAFGSEEASAAVIYWTGAKFEWIWMTD